MNEFIYLFVVFLLFSADLYAPSFRYGVSQVALLLLSHFSHVRLCATP